MKLTKSQFKRWMTAKTRQYIAMIAKENPDFVRISFPKNFNQYDNYIRYSEGACSKNDNLIIYRTDYLEWWNANMEALENLVIHEVCHLVHDNHSNAFFEEYKKWSGDDFIERYKNGDIDYIKNGSRYVCSVKNLPHLSLKEH